MALGSDVMIGVSVNNVTGITGKAYTIRDLVHAGVEAEAMGFDGIWVHDAMMGRRTTAAYCPITALTAVAAQTDRLKLCGPASLPRPRPRTRPGPHSSAPGIAVPAGRMSVPGARLAGRDRCI